MAISELSFTLYENTTADTKLGDMAAQVALQNFDLRYATLLFFNSTFGYGVEVFLRLYHYNIVVNRAAFRPALVNKTRQFVFFASDTSDVEQLLDVIIDNQLDNNGKFIIICVSSVEVCDEQDVMQLCWSYKIVNIVFIRLEAKEAVGFTYYPVADGMCYNVKPVQLDCDYNQFTRTSYGEIFKKKFQNFNFCPVIASTFIQTPYMINITNGIPRGADGDLLRLLIYGLNASLKVITPVHGDGWGFRQANKTWMGSLADINDDFANFSMTSAALTLSRFSDFQISTSYYTVKIVWVTHPAKLQNVALKLLHPFGKDTRVALVISFLLVVLFAFVIKADTWASMCRRIVTVQPTKSIVFYAWMICMGQSIIKLPTRSSFLQMTLIWVWYCFLIRTAYQVYLISSMKGKFYEGQFQTIEEVMEARYPFGGGAALKEYYIDYPMVYDNWVNIESTDIVPTALNISQGMNFVLAMNMDTAKIIMKNNKVSLHILPQIIVTSPTVLFFKKFSPLTESINRVLSRLTTSGFPDKLHKVYASLHKMRYKNSSTEGETMKIKHFTACYVILILGWILSALFFSLEVYFGKIYQHPVESLNE